VVVVVVGGTVVVVGGGGDVVGGEVGGGVVVGGGLVGGGLVGDGLAGIGPAGEDVGRVVVEEDGLEPGWDVGGAVTIVPEAAVRSSVPLERTVNQLFANPWPPARDREWSPAKK
jgi:hypothetical protein